MMRLDDVVVTDIIDSNTIRLIARAYIDEPALAPLADDAEALGIIEEIDSLTSAAGGFIGSVPSGVDPEELLTEADGFGWAQINAAFCRTRIAGGRFNGSERGA